jgi:hypothetical protein
MSVIDLVRFGGVLARGCALRGPNPLGAVGLLAEGFDQGRQGASVGHQIDMPTVV